MDSPAWRSLDVYERVLYVEFKARYNGANNGDIAFSGTEMEAAMKCSNKPADRALRTLIERGFVRVSRPGHFDWKRTREGGNRSSTYILTEYPVDWPTKSAMPATKDFMKWRPEKKCRGDESTPSGGREHPKRKGIGCAEHSIRVTRAPDMSGRGANHGVTRAPAYSVPGEAAVEAAARAQRASHAKQASAPQPTADEQDFCRRHGISFDDLASIPDRKRSDAA